MTKYDPDKINAIPIRLVADRLGIQMTKKGSAVFAKCVFHSDKHPSMVVGGKINNVHCYTCGESANVIKLVKTHQNIDFLAACKWIEDNVPEYDIRKEDNPCGANKVSRREARNEAIINRKRVGKEGRKPYVMPDSDKPPATVIQSDKAEKSSFAMCLKEVFGEEAMQKVIKMYRLGAMKVAGRYPDVLYPLIDKDGNIRDAKAQAYDCDKRSDGFFHTLKTCTRWIGPMMFPDAEFNRECLFGEHLLPRFPDRIVALVESPKNACVACIKYPKYIWVATGNKNMLKREVLEVLRNRKVIVFPDEDAFEEWESKLSTMRDIATFQCVHTPGEGEKRDIADWIVSKK